MKRILIVFDEPGWCFESHALQIQKRSRYSITVAHRKQNIVELAKKNDLVYSMDPMPFRYPPQEKTIMGLRCEFLYQEHPQGAKGLYEKGFNGRCVSIKDKCSILHMVNRNQMNVFKDIALQPLLLCQHGVDDAIFDRSKYKKKQNDILTISVSGRGSPNKGFGLVQQACNESNCVIISSNYGHHQLTKEQMPELYNKADVHVCFSKSEGQNNPIMEAGAMGVPCISTRVGAAEEMIEDGVSGLLVNRDIESLKIALEKLKDDNVRTSMGEVFYEEIKRNWTWDTKINDFEKMFDMFFQMKG